MVKRKDSVGKENMVGPVCTIVCEECEAVYAGETERSLHDLTNIEDPVLQLERSQNLSILQS